MRKNDLALTDQFIAPYLEGDFVKVDYDYGTEYRGSIEKIWLEGDTDNELTLKIKPVIQSIKYRTGVVRPYSGTLKPVRVWATLWSLDLQPAGVLVMEGNHQKITIKPKLYRQLMDEAIVDLERVLALPSAKAADRRTV